MALTLSTTSQVAAQLKVDTSTVRDWAIKGTIPFVLKTPGGHYRFDLAAVESTLVASKRAA